jgi:hypothetical protein
MNVLESEHSYNCNLNNPRKYIGMTGTRKIHPSFPLPRRYLVEAETAAEPMSGGGQEAAARLS